MSDGKALPGKQSAVSVRGREIILHSCERRGVEPVASGIAAIGANDVDDTQGVLLRAGPGLENERLRIFEFMRGV